YVTRPCVLKATGAVAAVRLVNIKCPFRDQMTILSGSRQASGAGESKADAGPCPQADTAGTELRHATVAAADGRALVGTIGRRVGGSPPDTGYAAGKRPVGGGGGPTGNGASACRHDGVGRPRPGHGVPTASIDAL